jgi:uncharacterized protein with NAD-binding domain and iron-sulfur cluster
MAWMKVIVLGGGVAGMSAAHELIERDIEVVVYEARSIPGGKARSLPVPGSGKRGRGDLPAEHGFRFFPGFYKHLPDTMKRITLAGQADGVLGHLVPSSHVQLALEGRSEIVTPARFPTSFGDLEEAFASLLRQATTLGIPARDQANFVNVLLTLLTSCKERRFAEYEHQSWWEFSGAQTRSPAYGKFLADGLTRTLVAAKAREMSARTGGSILLQLLFDLARPGEQVDRVLNGPTNDVWIDPWLAHLRERGVDYRTEHEVQAIHVAGQAVSHVTVLAGGRPMEETADFYVAAVPVEVMRLLATDEIKQADPQLAGLNFLRTRWMNGVMFYLDRDVPVVHGHSLYVDSLWALTSISQRQFWPEVDFGRLGDGRVEGILSVDVSDWEAQGNNGKQAMYCSSEEVCKEVWTQLKRSLNDAGVDLLEDANVLRAFVDPDIRFPNPTKAANNLEPLLINTAGSWESRPEATTAIENLVLASDYVRTHTDLATMEGANEAARRAVNGILERAGSTQPRCRLWPLSEPRLFAPARALDRILFALRRPPELPFRANEDGRIERSPLVSLGASVADQLSRLL